MYHHISEPPAGSDSYRIDLSVSPDDFGQQLAYLRDNGFETVSLADLSLAIANQAPLPERPVVITLDDGYVDGYSRAFPILNSFGFVATYFVPTEFVDHENPAHLSWPMIEEMSAAGMEILPHSKTHADLRILDRDGLVWEILGSTETIEAHTGRRPRFFAYPSGHYDYRSIQMLKDLHYWGAVTTQWGHWRTFDNRFEWPRMRVRYSTALVEFADLLNAQ